MSLYFQLRDAVARVDESEAELALRMVPSPPNEDLGHPLLETIVTLGPELAGLAADRLSEMRDGRGMVFLMEALTTPNLRVAAQIVELLDFEILGTGWVRLGKVLEALPARSRRRMISRLVEDPYLVPSRRWESICTRIDEEGGLEIILAVFDKIADEGDDHLHPQTMKSRSTEFAFADALVSRLEKISDGADAQEAITKRLLRVLDRHQFVARRLMKLLTVDGVCARNRTVLRCLSEEISVLARGHIDAAVPAFVAMAVCDDDEMSTMALEHLDELAALGSPFEWYPLMKSGREGALAVAMRAFEQQPSDVSWALSNLLQNADTDIRVQGAATVGHRLLRGQVIGPETLQQCLRLVAFDAEPAVPAALDVLTILRHAESLTRYYAATELLRTRHASLLVRTVDVLLDEDVWSDITGTRRLDLLTSALLDAFVNVDEADAECLQGIVTLISRLPPSTVVKEFDRAMPRLLDASHRRKVVDHLDRIGDPDWRAACDLYTQLDDKTHPPPRVLSIISTPERVWALIPALRGNGPKVAQRALKQIGTLCNALAVDEVIHALDNPDIATNAAETLTNLRHPAGMDALRRADSLPMKWGSKLERRLARVTMAPFVWPAAVVGDDTETHQLYQMTEALQHCHQSIFRSDAVKPPGSPVGRIILSPQAWWQLDRDHDDVITWDGSLMFRLKRGPLTSKIGDWLPLSLEMAQARPWGTLEFCVGFWVHSNRRVEKLREYVERPSSWLHFTDIDRFLAEVRGHLQQRNLVKAMLLIEALS